MAQGGHTSEASPLLSQSSRSQQHHDVAVEVPDNTDIVILPLAFTSALAMAATAATSIYAYATLLCQDSMNCSDSERNIYSGSVALATTIANICGLFAVGPLQRISERSRRVGLGLWMVVRSTSVIALALGVYFHSALIALSGRISQGLASDNILHFTLNSVYVQTSDKQRASLLIGTSLSLYMLGISLSPFIAGLFTRFETSFIMALMLFGVSLVYLLLFVKPIGSKPSIVSEQGSLTQQEGIVYGPTLRNAKSLRRVFTTVFYPLRILQSRPLLLFAGLSMLMYNTVQSYIFSAILVYTSVEFHFSARNNGLLISLVHAVSAVYLLSTVYIAPNLPWLISRIIHRRMKSPQNVNISQGNTENPESTTISQAYSVRIRSSLLGLASLAIQCFALLLLAAVREPWQIYPVSGLLALGLATPSFIKSYVVAQLAGSTAAARGVAALAVCEMLGSLLSPIVLGGMQTRWPGIQVFYTAAAIVGAAGSCFSAAIGLAWWEDTRYKGNIDEHGSRSD